MIMAIKLIITMIRSKRHNQACKLAEKECSCPCTIDVRVYTF